MLKDLVRVTDRGFARLRNRVGEIVAGREFDTELPVVQVKGWVTLVARRYGKKVPGLCRDGHNIWTNTGREYLSMLMTYDTNGSTRLRTDQVAYFGWGTGSQTEDAGVTGLVTPVAYTTGQFLAAVDHTATTFPLNPTRTSVKYYRLFTTAEITFLLSFVSLTEIGLFTNGNQSTFAPAGRDTTLANAASQSPLAYKAFEPIGKTTDLELEASWEIRF